MLHLASGLNTEAVKYGIVVLLTPLWLPFIKALWKSLNAALREEGGLLGAPPTEEELRELRHSDPLADAMISEERFVPFSAHRLDGDKAGGGPQMGGGSKSRAGSGGTNIGRNRGFGPG